MYKIVLAHLLLYMVVQGCIWLYEVAYGCTRLYMVVQGSIWLSKIPKLSFKVVQGCTGFYKDVHDRAKLYIVVLGCTKLYIVSSSLSLPPLHARVLDPPNQKSGITSL